MGYGQQHLTDEQAEQFRRRRMNADEKALWDRHLAGCSDCLERVFGGKHSSVASHRLMEGLLAPADEEFHLSTLELQRYLSGSMDEADRTIFASHLEDCPACRSHADALATEPVGLSPNPLPAEPRSFSFWHRFGFAWPSPVAVAAVLVACLFLGWRLWYLGDSGDQVSRRGTPGAEIVVRLQDEGHEITLDKKGTLTGLESLDPATKGVVRDVLESAGLSKPQVLGELSSPDIKFMGQGGSASPFALISPIGSVVAEEQPTLRWEPMGGATGYTVAIFDSQFRPVTKSQFQRETQWRVSVPLRRGLTYFWQVTANKSLLQIVVPSAPAPRAEFQVLDSQTAADLERVRKFVPESHLALGILYARAGMRLDAERELEALVRENQQSPLAAKLLNDVQSWGNQKPSPTTTKPAQ